MIHLTYKAVGTDNKERILFLNPLGAPLDVWKFYTELLSDRFEILLLNYPGFNDTEYQELDSIQELSTSIENTIKTLEPKPLHIVGYSLGGFIAQYLAVSKEINIDSLILIGSSYKVYNQGKHLAKEWIKLIEDVSLESFLSHLALWSFSSHTFEANPHSLRSFVISSLRGCNNQLVYKNQLELIKQFTTNVDLTNISVPTLVICGEYDSLYPRCYSEMLAQTIPNSELLIVKNSGHAVPWEAPNIIIKKFNEFLKVRVL